jgi:hypothetical protein
MERGALMLRSLLFALLAPLALHAAAPRPGADAFAREVDLRLDVAAPVAHYYAKQLDDTLERAGVTAARPQYVLLVDRSAQVQAGFVYWRSPDGGWQLVGAAPVATGRPGEYEHFLTPLGAFAHSLANPDFRAEGTRNALGIRGYGVKGMRVYDFGWVEAERTWDPGGESRMRLQVHSTDPDLLEPLLGSWHSKGCIRIPASLNVFIDRYGLLDADYEAALRAGHRLWMLRTDREPTATPGRWLVVIDSQHSARPPWAVPSTRRKE